MGSLAPDAATVPLQFSDAVTGFAFVLLRVLLAAAVAVAVFGAARWLLPRLARRLAARNGWSANGEAVVVAASTGAAATLALHLALSVAGVVGYAGTVLVVGGVATGVGVERRRLRVVSPVTELLAAAAALLAIGIVVTSVGGLVQAAGVFVAAGVAGALGRDAVAVVTTASRGGDAD
ncbi:hypothetical protein [Halobaculum sp. D14]|uniref:hypothetical protein n=1 Tax=Halobaculum sp. D14 TaxID=3421642 RepID=UPI003EBF3E58